jgi:hypothetical protein
MSSYQVYHHKGPANYYIYLRCSLYNPTVNYDHSELQIYEQNSVITSDVLYENTNRNSPWP